MALINVNLGQRRRPRRRGPGPYFPRGRKPWWWGLVVLVLAGLSYFAKQQGWINDSPTRAGARRQPPARVEPTPAPAGPTSAETDVAELIRSRKSNAVIESSGVVAKTLSDDNDGARHQRFIVRVGDETVLVAHNLDLAPRVPVKVGEAVRFKGEFEWNDRGGVIHWTHHDPQRRQPGGWIELRGKRYE